MIAPGSASLGIALLLTAPVSLLAQQQEPPLAPGERVRVSAPTLGLNRQVGTVVEMGANSCTLQYGNLDHGRLTLPIASLTKLEVSRGKKSNTLKGLLSGFFVGAPAGAVVGLFGTTVDNPSKSGEPKFCDGSVLECTVLWGVAFGAAGGLVGLGIGALSRTDRWEEVRLDRLRVGILLDRDRRLALSVRFAF